MPEEHHVLADVAGEIARSAPLGWCRAPAPAAEMAAAAPGGHVVTVRTAGRAAPTPPADDPRGLGEAMKTFLGTLAGTFLGAALAVLAANWWAGRHPADPPAPAAAEFAVTPNEVAADLIGRTVAAQGQVWLFTPDQQVTVKVLEARAVPGATQVVAEVSSVVKFPPPPKEAVPIVPKAAETRTAGSPPAAAAPDGAPKAPTRATISGVGRLTYERAAGKWFLTGVESLSLGITAE